MGYPFAFRCAIVISAQETAWKAQFWVPANSRREEIHGKGGEQGNRSFGLLGFKSLTQLLS